MVQTEPPKLFTHKPKRAQVKQSQGNVAKDFPLQQASAPPPPSSSTPPSASVNESFARRYKYLWPILLTVNLTYGAYLYMRIKRKDSSGEEETTAAAVAVSAPDSVSTTSQAVSQTTAPSVDISAPVSTQASALSTHTAVSQAITTSHAANGIVPEKQQRELFEWILDEKRKIKPKDAEEKKRIDTEKAVLKKFISAQSIPRV